MNYFDEYVARKLAHRYALKERLAVCGIEIYGKNFDKFLWTMYEGAEKIELSYGDTLVGYIDDSGIVIYEC